MLSAQIGSGINETLNIYGSHSRIVGLETYQDVHCTTPLTQIDWGTLSPGETTTQKVYVKNVGDTWQQWTVTTQNWTPPQTQHFLTFSTNYLNFWTVPQDTLEIQFTLTVSPEITNVTDFCFDIVVSGK